MFRTICSESKDYIDYNWFHTNYFHQNRE